MLRELTLFTVLLRISAACLLFVMTGCVLDEQSFELGVGEQEVALAPGQNDEQVLAPERLAPSFQVIPKLASDSGDASGSDSGDRNVALAGAQLIFLNRNGGTYSGDNNGQNDSRNDITALIPQLSSVSIDPFTQGDDDWNQLYECVRQKFRRFDVEITDQDPCAGSGGACTVPHLEAVVGGRYTDFENLKQSGGVSPFTSDCDVINNSIVFSFAEHFGSDIEQICDITVQEIAHSYGLDHQYLCEDPMSYLKTHPLTGATCENRSFMNFDAPCGEDDPRACRNLELNYDCGRETQNSVAMLSAALGFVADPTPPTLSVLHPEDGMIVEPGFGVMVEATDDIAVDRVELLIDGDLAFVDAIPPYELHASDLVTDGMHEIEVRVYDAENYTTQSFQVDVDGEAASENIIGTCQAAGSAPGLWLWLPLLGWLYWRGRRTTGR